jgi:hypothetical protein
MIRVKNALEDNGAIVLLVREGGKKWYILQTTNFYF